METSILSDVKERLRQYPEVKYLISGQRLFIPQCYSGPSFHFETGFQVEIFADITPKQTDFVVKLDAVFDKHFASKGEAIHCFLLALSGHYRVKELRKGTSPFKMILERRGEGDWIEEASRRFPIYPFWRRTDFAYLENHLIDL